MKTPDTPLAVLVWLNAHARRLDFQELVPSSTRRKNRVLLQFRDSSGAIQVVGGRNLWTAVQRAALRLNRPKELLHILRFDLEEFVLIVANDHNEEFTLRIRRLKPSDIGH
jgi:hypothetical protein